MKDAKLSLSYLYIRFIFSLFIALIHQINISYGQIDENFSDGELSNAPTWIGNLKKFSVIENSLQSNCETPNSKYYISTHNSSLKATQWTIELTLNFKTSSANYVDIYLASDSSNPSKATCAYYVRMGGTKDKITLNSIYDGIQQTIIHGEEGKTENKKISLTIIREQNGEWILTADYHDKNGPIIEGKAMDNLIDETTYFSILIRQSTPSFFKKHRINYIYVGPIIRDKTAPKIDSFWITDPKTIHLRTNEKIQVDSVKLTLESLPDIAIQPQMLNNQLTLSLSDSLTNGPHILNVKRMIDIKGNARDTTIYFLLQHPQISQKGDLVINEILFNPFPYGKDFIELVNISEKFIRLNDLTFRRYLPNQTFEVYPISSKYIIPPNKIFVITTDSNQIKYDYPSAINLVQVPNIPSMNNDQGILSLYNNNDKRLDSISYTEGQHISLLSDYNGVSLERIRYAGHGYDPNNWHSASSHIGYATPGRENSQLLNDEIQTNNISLSSSTISPDGDGYEDYLTLKYLLGKSSFTLNGYIYTLDGRFVHQPFNQELLGTNGILKWDGLTNQGAKLSIGNYILLIEASHIDGTTIRKKLAFAITGIF